MTHQCNPIGLTPPSGFDPPPLCKRSQILGILGDFVIILLFDIFPVFSSPQARKNWHFIAVFRGKTRLYKAKFQNFRLRRYLQCIFDLRIAIAPSINAKTEKMSAPQARKFRKSAL